MDVQDRKERSMCWMVRQPLRPLLVFQITARPILNKFSTWLAAISIALGIHASRAQMPFAYSVNIADSAYTYQPHVERMGPDQYRLLGHCAIDDEGWFWQADLSADGTIGPMVRVHTDVTYIPYEPVSLLTADGGHLYSYQYSTNSTRYLAFLRVAEDGTPLWERRYPSTAGTFLSQSADVLAEKDDGFYILGMYSEDAFAGSGYYLLHIGADGSFLDAVYYGLGDVQSTIADQLVHTADNGLIAVSTEHPYYSNAHYRYVSVQRFNAAREPLWSYKYSYGDFHLMSSVVETADGGILFSGRVRLAYPGPFVPFLFKVDSLGQVLWGRITRFASPATTYDVIEEADGHLLWLGADSVNNLVARMDSTGVMEEVIRYTLPPSGNFVRWSYDASANERLLAGPAHYPHGLMEVMRVDENLLPPCGYGPGPLPIDSLALPEVTDFPISLIADTLFSFDSTAVTSTGVIVVTDPCLSTAIVQPDPALAIPWPNPCSSVLHIPWVADQKPHTIAILDAQGRLVREFQLTGSGGSLDVDMQGLRPGIHLVRISSRDAQRSWRFVME